MEMDGRRKYWLEYEGRTKSCKYAFKWSEINLLIIYTLCRHRQIVVKCHEEETAKEISFGTKIGRANLVRWRRFDWTLDLEAPEMAASNKGVKTASHECRNATVAKKMTVPTPSPPWVGDNPFLERFDDGLRENRIRKTNKNGRRP